MPQHSSHFRKDALIQLQASSKRYYMSDQKVRGLRLAVYPSGIKTFILYRKVKGVPERIKIGRFPDITIEQARSEAQRLISLITLGQTPHKDRIAERKALTFRELYEHYYEQHAIKFTKRPLANKKMMGCQVFPVFGNCKVNQITTEQIRKFHTDLANKAKPPKAGRSEQDAREVEKYKGATANRLVAIISAVFNFGIRENYINTVNPCNGIRKFKTVSRDRFLTFGELESFFAALEEETELFQDFFKILLYTGARKSNVLSMQWSDINLDLKRWRIAETQTKNKDVNIIPLSEMALQILKVRNIANQKEEPPSSFVFPGTSEDGYLKDPKRAFDRIRKRMKVSDIRMHDLRRTLGSYMAIGGVSLPIIGKALNHKSQVSTAIYARLSNDPILDAVNKASKLMNSAIRLQKETKHQNF
ncbi:site-specific integrase [Spirosoma sp. KNUC1025]|uniref:tyrosine-type recombinase/integrase n=1 Tax=Spirosoma sp. KNUC1025 TaxID=2894082 RepID=UPI00386E310A|nr:site-specific integrase [Spirosoma sp. KNUC1025]